VIISHAVWLYFRIALSYRDVEELLAERGVKVTYETIRQWCRKFGRTLCSVRREYLNHVPVLARPTCGASIANTCTTSTTTGRTRAGRSACLVPPSGAPLGRRRTAA
jgi:hypothetical protein